MADVERDARGRVLPGKSLNPAGRKPGSGYRQRAEAQLANMLKTVCDDRGMTASEVLIEKMIEEARAGQPWALKLALDRILPATLTVEQPDIVDARSPLHVPTLDDEAALLGSVHEAEQIH